MKMARVTGLEPATSGVTGRHSNRLSYTRALSGKSWPLAPLSVSIGVAPFDERLITGFSGECQARLETK